MHIFQTLLYEILYEKRRQRSFEFGWSMKQTGGI